MYWYILVYTHHVTGFRGKHRDAAVLEEPGPSVESEHGHEDGDPSPCPEGDNCSCQAPEVFVYTCMY